MAWEPKTVLLCIPAGAEAPASELCPSGHALATQTVFVPTHDPSLPTADDVQVGVWAFGLVVVVYVLSAGLGALLSLFRSRG